MLKRRLIEEALVLAETKFALDVPRDKNRAVQVNIKLYTYLLVYIHIYIRTV